MLLPVIVVKVVREGKAFADHHLRVAVFAPQASGDLVAYLTSHERIININDILFPSSHHLVTL